MPVHRKTGFLRQLSEVARARRGFGAGLRSGMVPHVLGAILAGTITLASGAASAAQLTLDWVDNSGGSAGFQIERRAGTTGAFGQIATTGAGVTSYVDSTVPAGTTFCYRVRASNGGGTSGYSNVACAAAAASGLDVTVVRAGAGSGTVTSQPPGISCGGDCVGTFLVGTAVTLTATPASGSTFGGWGGGGCTGTGPCVIAGNNPVQVTATFVPIATAPTATITSPASGATVSGSVDVAVNATAGNGTVARVELLVDGAVVATDSAPPWALSWNSTGAANGSHSLVAKAYNTAGTSGTSAAVPVSVNNTSTGPAPAIALAFAGRVRDRVGESGSAPAPDGVLDGTFTLTLAPGSGARTISRLELRRHNSPDAWPDVWDTVPSSAFWTLGVARSPDGQLLNGGSGINVPLAAGASLTLFAADVEGLFAPGSSFTITASFADASTASANTTVAATPAAPPAASPTLALAFAGFARDRVGPGGGAFAPNGILDGIFTLTLAPGSGTRTVTKFELRRQNSSDVWDTLPTSAFWTLGVANSFDDHLLNGGSGVSVQVGGGASLTLFAADMAALYASGSSFTITATFADGSTATATAHTQ
jgi:Bacterial Ig domain/Divergent InlB B-repeat domain